MVCQGNFIFKTLTFRKDGVFTTEEGKQIKYPSSYILKVDEIREDGYIIERKFKIKEDKTSLVNALKNIEAYQKIILEFDVNIIQNKILLDVLNVVVDNYSDILD